MRPHMPRKPKLNPDSCPFGPYICTYESDILHPMIIRESWVEISAASPLRSSHDHLAHDVPAPCLPLRRPSDAHRGSAHLHPTPRGWRELFEHQGKYFVADAITIRTSSYTDLDGNRIDAGALYRHTVSARQVTPTSFGEPTTISIGWGDLRHVLGDEIAHDLHGIAI